VGSLTRSSSRSSLDASVRSMKTREGGRTARSTALAPAHQRTFRFPDGWTADKKRPDLADER